MQTNKEVRSDGNTGDIRSARETSLSIRDREFTVDFLLYTSAVSDGNKTPNTHRPFFFLAMYTINYSVQGVP